MRTVGFVCEGPRDSDLLEAVIQHILEEKIYPLYLQPEPSLTGQNGNGWKGVWKWCVKNGETIDQFVNGALPKIDLIVVQMDADVARKEREVHCLCYTKSCDKSGKVFPLDCTEENCPIDIPCISHTEGVKSYVEHLQRMLLANFKGEYIPVCVIPSDSTDAWIVAAFDNFEDVEKIQDPWNNIISRGKQYHGIRVPGHKKVKSVYDKMIPVVCSNWDIVKQCCSQANYFDELISNLRCN